MAPAALAPPAPEHSQDVAEERERERERWRAWADLVRGGREGEGALEPSSPRVLSS